jgi:hypothetical protein
MRRIYESDALAADDEDPFKPNRGEDRDEARSIRWSNASHALLPMSIRRRAIVASVETDREVYGQGDVVRFRVGFENRFPIPVALRTTSPVRWSWSIDGVEQASRVDDEPPSDPALFRFDRSERKRFHRRWRQRFRESDDEWSTAPRGDYVLRVWVAGEREHVAAETTFRIE